MVTATNPFLKSKPDKKMPQIVEADIRAGVTAKKLVDQFLVLAHARQNNC